MNCKSCGLFSVFEYCTQCRKHEKRTNKFLRSAAAEEKKKKKKPAKRRASSSFYKTWKWKQLRYEVLKFYGCRCMCCGATERDGKRIVVDHIYPRSKFPKLELDFNNLQVLCNDCNMGKGADDYTDFREQLPEGAYEHMDSILRH